MIRLAFLLSLFILADCVDLTTSQCSDGTYCPAARICMPAGGCVDRAQLAACSDRVEGEGCSLEDMSEGICRGGLCLSANCGDAFVNPGEACDDGNTLGGDGCSANCDKLEICGDATLDVGEACDDGNSNAVDGCDSCVLTEWRVSTPITGAEENALSDPTGVAFDVFGNLFISDTSNGRIRRVDALTGAITTVAGNGSPGFSGDGGAATGAQLDSPTAITIDGLGNLFFSDTNNNRLRRVDALTGVITTVAGNGIAGFSGDGDAATSAQLDRPFGLAVDGQGTLFFADNNNHRIRRVDGQTGVISTVVGSGIAGFSGDGGAATSAQISGPSGLALDGMGNLFFADNNNKRVRRVDVQIDDDEIAIITTVAGNGIAGFSGDGIPATSAQLSGPSGLTIDSLGNLFIADTFNSRIRRVDAQSGIITTVAGNGTAGFLGDDGAATSAQLDNPSGINFDGIGNLLIVDRGNHRVRRVDGQTSVITTVAGDGTSGSGDDGAATSARFDRPSGITLDDLGNLFIADKFNHRIRRVDGQTGVITTVAGNGTAGSLGDGSAATSAELNNPFDVARDGMGNLFIADTSNHRVRRVDGQTGVITTMAGTGTAGFLGDGGAAIAARLGNLNGIALDGSGNLFIADTSNNRVRRIDVQTGIITTVAGNGTGGFSGDDGAATSAELDGPSGITLDSLGNLFIADTANHRVRRVDGQTSIITTFAGDGTNGFSGDGGAATGAELDAPVGVTLDGMGNLFIADTQNFRVRRVDAQSGVITTVAGNGAVGFSGDGGAATSARLHTPHGVVVDGMGNFFIATLGSDRVRRIDAQTGIITTVAGDIDPIGMGPAASAKLVDPQQLVRIQGSLFIAGGSSGTLQRLRDGFLTVVAGRYPNATSNLARFQGTSFGSVGGVAHNTGENIIYLSETSNHAIVAITIVDADDPNTWIIANLAGQGAPGFVDGMVSAARFRSPTGMLRAGDTLYVADSANHVIRAIGLTSGLVSTIAGTGQERGFFGDGGDAGAAQLFSPQALTRCPNGDLFIADTGNHRVRRIDENNIISTVLGDGVAASSGQGQPAFTFPVNAPLGIDCDQSGNVFITSTSGVRLLPANDNGIVDGSGAVQTIYGAPPRDLFPENTTRCLTAIMVVDDTHLQLTDSCTGILIELERVSL